MATLIFIKAFLLVSAASLALGQGNSRPTTEGNANGASCVFPFIYKGAEYRYCPPYKGFKWCATTANYDTDKKWGYCPVDGAWLNWGWWTPCTNTCGPEKKFRSRSCIYPTKGGRDCLGKRVEQGSCNNKDCPVRTSDCPNYIIGDAIPIDYTTQIYSSSVRGSDCIAYCQKQRINYPDINAVTVNSGDLSQTVCICKRGATDTDKDQGYQTCFLGPVPKPKTCDVDADVGFILDSSGSIEDYYSDEKTFLNTLAAYFNIGTGKSRASVITFSADSQLTIKFNQFDNLQDFQTAVTKIPLMGSITYMDRALRLAQGQMFLPTNGARAGKAKVLILLTDGEQSEFGNYEEPAVVVQDVRKDGINVIVIGMGDGISEQTLTGIAGGWQYYYKADTFEKLADPTFLSKVTASTCDAAEESLSMPTRPPVTTPTTLRCKGVNDGCCTKATPCSEGDGDCDNDSQCAKGLFCGTDNCPWGDNDDCCVPIVIPDGLRCKGVNDGCCTSTTPCLEGDGDCDNDAQCAAGLVCGKDNCPWGDNDDCCVKGTRPTVAATTPQTTQAPPPAPCFVKDVDYKGNDIKLDINVATWADCGHQCTANPACKFFTFVVKTGCCYHKGAKGDSTTAPGLVSGNNKCNLLRCNGIDNGCCTSAVPCLEGDGDCDNDSHCAAGLVCGKNNCPWGDNDDCCVTPVIPRGLRCNGKNDGCCTTISPCLEGDGDCDQNSHCAAGLVCGTDNCPWGDNDDCCVKQ